jgi:cyanophycin synthetase
VNTPIKLAHPPVRLLTNCLLARGYTLREIQTRPAYREFTAPDGKQWLTLSGTVVHPSVTAIARQIASNKAISYQFAALNGASIPKTLSLPAEQTSLQSFLDAYAPLVVKPLDSHSSLGMTLDITTAEDLQTAVDAASAYSKKVLVQQQFTGQEVRFTILHGQVVHCLLREIPQVTGDGASTIKQLIEAENKTRRNLGFKIVPYPQLDETIIAAGLLTSSVVPADGEVVELSKSSLVGGGGIMKNVTDHVDASYKAVAEHLAADINPEFLIVDMLIRNLTVPCNADNYVFLEFNTSPCLRLYYDVRSGEDYDIVSELADMIDQWNGTSYDN